MIDPYQSYVEVDIEIDPNDYAEIYTSARRDAVPTFHFDGNATCLFDEMILYSNNQEVERVQ